MTTTRGTAASPPTLLYILSPSYSGSTLLTYLLARHPRIATVGELKATNMGDVELYTCSCGALITACPFWHRVTALCRQRGIPFSLDTFGTSLRSQHALTDRLLRAQVRGTVFEIARSALLNVLPSVRAETTALIQRNFDLSQVICEVQGRNIFLDGSKDSPRLLRFVTSGLWRVKTICLIRDGRGVVNSFMSRRAFDPPTAVARWQRTMTELLRLKARLNSRDVLDIRYESLCQDPSAVLRSIWSWLEIDDVTFEQNFRSGDYHILGNDMRLSQVSDIRLDERWRQTLDRNQLQYFDAHVGPLNRALGYQ